MAQIDTGLGWSAKDNWLMAGTGNIASIPGGFHWNISGFETQQIPVTAPTSIDTIAEGIQYMTYQVGRPGRVATYAGYIGANKPGAVAAYFHDVNTSPNRMIIYVPDQSFEIYRQSTENGNPQGALEMLQVQSTTIGGETVYYCYSQGSAGYNTDSFVCGIPLFPYYSNIQDCVEAGWNYVVQSVDIQFTKNNTGYAVACVANWYTSNGTLITSPILISSNSSFVEMSCDSASFNFANSSFLYEGIRFYMGFWDCVNQTFNTTLQIADLTQFGAASLEKVFNLLKDESFSNILVTSPPDPYQEPGSEEGGGDGADDEEDNVDFTDPPSTSIGATGFLTIFCPTLGQLQSLGTYMWGSFDVDNWRKLFANPMDAILGLHIIPVPAIITGNKAVKVAGIDTTIDMDYTTVRYIRRSMGTCDIPKKWGAYLDFTPYTKISVFLPYIGFKELDADDIMGKTIALQYIIDILTGACVAELKCGDTVLYSWQGNCANEVPISGSDWRGAISSALGIAATVATTVATGGATAPMIAGTIASVGANSLNLKPTINRSGAISGSAGFIGGQRPYIIRSVPNLVIPNDQNKFIGYPSFVTASLGSLTGYNEISAIHLEGIPATGNELSEIETLLKGGVIF